MAAKESGEKEKGSFDISGEMMSGGMMQMMGGFTVIRLMSMMSMTGIKPTKEQLLGLNAMLNQIKKPE